MSPFIADDARSDRTFSQGDQVFLAEGTYQGTPGVFLRLREDANWADIGEPNGAVRRHPVAWLAHAHPNIRLSGAIAAHQS